MSGTPIDRARRFASAGLLREALRFLDHQSATADAEVLRAELFLMRGQLNSACELATTCLRRKDLSSEQRARALRVKGVYNRETGTQKGTAIFEEAIALARKCENWTLFSRIQLAMLEQEAEEGASYARSVARCSATIRSVLKAADPMVLVEAHITFARLEARIGRFDVARRHLSRSEQLLSCTHNVQFGADRLLTEGAVLAAQGDLPAALRMTAEALDLSAECGWIKGESIAAGNLAVFSMGAGNSEDAERYLAKAKDGEYHTPSFDYALLDTAALIALKKRQEIDADSIWQTAARQAEGVQGWYKLQVAHTRTQILLRNNKADEALQFAERQLERSIELGNEFLINLFRLTVLNIRLSLGLSYDSSPLIAWKPPTNLSLLGARGFVASVALSRENPERGLRLGESAARILQAAGVLVSWTDREPDGRTVRSPELDDAAALVELAGYPHVLAREAFALLDGADVAERIALVARGATTVRVLAATRWDEAGARRAAADPQDRLLIVCGQHRDETWEVVADMKPSLSDRCTAVAIRQLVDTAVTLDRYRREEKQRTALWPADTFETDGGLFVSEQMSDLLSIARRIAPSDITVLLTGETGTGKEVLARAVHRASPRASKPFVPFNCTAVARDMLESQLFGYRKGAFTGADGAFEGVIRAAAGGTLFLDEIAEIGTDLQPKLLRFLETCEVHGLGEPQPVKVDIRVIAATNADLEAMVADGRFREDLFYRLNGVRLKLPPLRERREEIPPLIDHYLRKAAEEQKKGRLTLDDETLEYLLLYAWPGNVRQLVNEIRRIVAFAEPDSVVTPALLSPEIQASRRTIRVSEGETPEIRIHLDQPMGDALEAIEQAMVRRALERAHGNYENAARLLGISRKGLFLKRRRWGMQRAS